MKAKLLKKMTVDGKDLPQGSIVDVSGWRNYKSLESMRYFTFIVDDEKPKVVKEQPAVQEISLS